MELLLQSLRLRLFGRTRFFSLVPYFPQKGRRGTVTCIRMNIKRLCSLVEVSDFDCDELHDDSKATEKDTALRLALSQLSGEFSRESMLSLQRFFRSRRAPVISTGSSKLDLALGIGGLPKGRFVEIYGQEASGKTTLALQIIKEAQKLGGEFQFCVLTNSWNCEKFWGTNFVCLPHTNKITALPPLSSPYNMFTDMNIVFKSSLLNSAFNIWLRQVAALIPQCELDLPVGGSVKDVQPRMMTQALRKIHYALCHSQTLIIFLNQTRLNVKPGKHFGHMEEVTCGGNALKFYAAVRLRMLRTGLLKMGDKITGLSVCIQVVKNKLAPAMKKAELELQYGRGFCRASEVLELACEHGIILEEGSSYFIEGEVFGDRQAAKQYLMENDEVLDKIITVLRNKLFGTLL
ncbi:DNA repair protein recA homolog 2, mitochondrial [Carica papaya]|uniref:DNA repair protein recA homolog 2, mitochondrial n=1 Tax=Carica papaya TaxID=3649 RepID=UPI000B8CA545|nr:DNA repair protein recA homolog 2, mitochondrial [Carica papaya]